jgi:hypothetical protein
VENPREVKKRLIIKIRFLYGLAYGFKVKFFFGIPLIRQTSKTIGEKGEFRKGDSRITGAKIVPPPGLYVSDWMAFFVNM